MNFKKEKKNTFDMKTDRQKTEESWGKGEGDVEGKPTVANFSQKWWNDN